MKNEETMHNIENFLADDSLITHTEGSLEFFKETLTPRFRAIYVKNKSSIDNILTERDYQFTGFYDSLDKTLYESSYYLNDFLQNSTECKFSTFAKLREEINSKLIPKIEKYEMSNSVKLKNEAKNSFDDKLKNFHYYSYEDEVEKAIINNDIPETLNINYNIFPLFSFLPNELLKKFNNNSILIEYLENEESTVNDIFSNIIKDKEFTNALGLKLLECDYKEHYYNEILSNKKEYQYLFINQEILESIRDVDAKTLNITISYDKESLSFTFDKLDLEYDLKNGEWGTFSYCKSYDNVKEFLREHNTDDNIQDFEFSHITRITYGKRVLYAKELEETKENVKNEEFDRNM